jgi:hypothetical protein
MVEDVVGRDETRRWGPEPIEKEKLLVVEGHDERRLLSVLLKKLGRLDVQIIPCNGKDAMPTVLESLGKISGFSRVDTVGIVRDAESNAASAFQSVRDALLRGRFEPPRVPGIFSQGSTPRIGILIVPPGKDTGMLEDLCLEAIARDPVLPCIDEFFRCIASRAGRTPRSPSRSRVHAWLASQVDPFSRLGEAAERGYWPLDEPAFCPLHEFLGAL